MRWLLMKYYYHCMLVNHLQSEPDILLVDRHRKSALHYACEGGHLGCVQLLLEYDSPVYFKDQVGYMHTV